MKRSIRIGVIGFGRMGRGFVSMMQQDDRYEIVSICDVHEQTRELAGRTVPGAKLTADPDDILRDGSLHAVGLFTLADARPAQIRQALRTVSAQDVNPAIRNASFQALQDTADIQ